MTSTRRTSLLAGFAVSAALLVLPSAAAANVYCVGTTPPECTDFPADFQAALDAAEANAGDDTVRLGAGTFTGAQVLGFRYFAGNGKVDIIGAGQGQTTLTVPADDGTMFQINEVLRLDASGGGSTVSDLTVALPTPSNNNMFVSQYKGVVLQQGQASRVTVTAPATAINGYGFWPEAGPVTIEDSTVAFPLGMSAGETAVLADAATTVEDSTITADDTFVARTNTTSQVIRSTLRGRDIVVDVEEGTFNLLNSVVDLGAFEGIGVRSFGSAGAETATLNLDHVTIGGIDSDSWGIQIRADDAAQADSRTATITNSVISGPGIAIRREADQMDTANVTTDYSNYNAAGNVSSNGTTGMGMTVETNQTNLPPSFANMLNYRLLPSSPLIDIGDPAPASGALDIDGDPRALDGSFDCSFVQRRDVGADEYSGATQGTPASCNPPLLTPTPATPTTPAAPKKKCKKRKKKSRGAVVAKKKRCKKKKRRQR